MTTWLAGALASAGCSEKLLDASEPVVVVAGDPCGPGDEAGCGEGLACEPLVTDAGTHLCAEAVEIHGSVIDALDGSPIVGARVAATDELGTPVTTAVRSDAEGRFVLPVSLARDEDGTVVETRQWMLLASAAGYLAFPGPLRPALPFDSDGRDDEGIVESSVTTVSLVPSLRSGVTITGRVEGQDPAGTLVIAEGPMPAPLSVVDAEGGFVLFDVPPGAVTIRGLRQGLELEPRSLAVAAGEDIEDVVLLVLSEDPATMATVSGSVVIADAQGGGQTSVVLVPTVTYVEALERGPVPAGLRAPAPPQAPSISSTFEITGVPAGSYTVLAGYENDALIRDPDASIAGTQVQQIAVARGATVELESAVRLTAALVLVGPGAEGPELVDGAPTFSWEDDASEDRYSLVVRDARGDEVWRDDELPRVTGVSEVEVPYAGPALTSGMTYQFRVEAWRDNGGEPTVISRTEDLRGVFVAR
ncbi:MAG: hypothetical protein H6712_14710 [Myxococcales bacterium]|nr:hypothetical protein [Myxococcales bacterium]MCB9715115.1 hypothetical protein [Myxococcales bacterium]